MNELPRKLKVGPSTYAIRDDADEMNRISRREKDDLFGYCDHRHLTIHIDPDQADDYKRETVLHEVLHAVVSLTNLSEEWGVEKEERMVARVAPLLLGVLRDNPKLVAYLVAAS